MSVLQIGTPIPLSVAMRDGSMAEHKDAEGSAFMSSLLAGEVSTEGYVSYLAMLREIYAALERTGRDRIEDPIVAAVWAPSLERLASIDDDLDYFSGDASTHKAPVIASPATQAYVSRIEASAAWGGLFAAHHYTRYLGDLSGGQAIRRILTREYDVDDRGVRFYQFPAIAKPKLFKDGYRARLDALGLSPQEQTRVVDEVKVAFNLNQGLFEELSGRLSQWRRNP